MFDNKLLREIYEIGKKYNATHLITYTDTFEYSDFYKYVGQDETVDQVLTEIKSHGSSYRIDNIYSYDIDIDEKLPKKKTYHL